MQTTCPPSPSALSFPPKSLSPHHNPTLPSRSSPRSCCFHLSFRHPPSDSLLFCLLTTCCFFSLCLNSFLSSVSSVPLVHLPHFPNSPVTRVSAGRLHVALLFVFPLTLTLILQSAFSFSRRRSFLSAFSLSLSLLPLLVCRSPPLLLAAPADTEFTSGQSAALPHKHTHTHRVAHTVCQCLNGAQGQTENSDDGNKDVV